MFLRPRDAVFLVFECFMLGVTVCIVLWHLPGLVRSESPDKWVGMACVCSLPALALMTLWETLRIGKLQYANLMSLAKAS